MKHTCLILVLILASISSSALTINLVADAALAANTPAMQAFQRAAAQWESRFSDPITVNVNVGLADLGSSSILGQAGSTFLYAGYTTLRNQMIVDAQNESSNGIVNYLPTSPSFLLPTGFSYSGYLGATKANLKALGFTGLDASYGASDGTITFNSTFNFDFDRSNGLVGFDFEAIAVHELGHILGFSSMVNNIDYMIHNGTSGVVDAFLFDLFRFNQASVPTTTSAFTTTARDLRPGQAASFSDTTNSYALATGTYNGDGAQASHWKNDEDTGINLGVMDPSIAYAETHFISDADIRVFDLIGYDVIVPEPGTLLLMLIGLLGVAYRAYRK